MFRIDSSRRRNVETSNLSAANASQCASHVQDHSAELHSTGRLIVPRRAFRSRVLTYRRIDVLKVLVTLSMIVALTASPAATAGDPIAAFLERHELTDVLARHLEERIERADEDERETLILRLADIYTKLLDEEADPARRLALEQRSRRLLELAPRDSADELRLVLLRNTYRAAERIAENHRLRLAEPAEVEKARRQFAEIIPELLALTEQLDRTVTLLERRVSRAGRTEGAALDDRLTKQRRTLMQSRYVHGWSLYYKAYLSNRDDEAERHARQAQRIFADLLMTESSHPRPEEVSVDLRSIEPLARSIVGMALCQSITSSWGTAIDWIDLLTHENAAPEVKHLLDGWRVLIYLEHGQFRAAYQVLTDAVERGESIPISWLRLAAVGALESGSPLAEAGALARFTMTQLASRGELQQVLDLAERYGTFALGDTGFAMRYIEGLVSYRQARERHDHDAPTTDAELLTLYRAARQSFELALLERDVAEYPDAADSIHMLIAWSSFYANDLLGAADRFQSIAESQQGERAEQALWMAIVALDRLLAREENVTLRRRHTELTERFLDDHAGSHHAPTLLVNRSMREEELSDEVIERLLSIAPGHEARNPARRRALHALYRDFRRSGDRSRGDRAYRYLSVAVPMLDELQAFGSEDDPQRTSRLVLAIRQTLEVALHADVGQARDARAAIDAFDAIDQDHDAVRQYADELRFRRVQLALLEGDREEAERMADELWDDDYRSRTAQLSSRAMFHYAERLWQAAAVDSREHDEATNLIIRFGGRVLREFEDDDDPLAGAGAAGVARTVADASMADWLRTGDEERGRIALFLTRHLLERQPNHRTLLRNFAILSGVFDQPNESLDAWRRLVAGSEHGSEAWFEARYHQIRLLAEINPARAARLIQQHRQFYPDYGPEPWGEKLRMLVDE